MTLISIHTMFICRSRHADQQRGKAEEFSGGPDAAAAGSKALKQNGGSGAGIRSDGASSQAGHVAA